MSVTSETSDKTTSSNEERTGRVTGLLMVAAAVSAVSSLLYGYDTGVISGALLQIRKEFHTDSFVEQLIAGAILLGAVLGALGCSRLSEQWGRRRTVLLVSVVFAVGALAAASAPTWWSLCLARIVLGFAVGGATQTVPMFVAELAPTKQRGRLVLTFQIGIGVGIVVSTIVGATSAWSWRVSVALAAIPALIMLGLALRLPESPRWLVRHERRDDAEGVLEKLRPSGADIEPELREIEQLDREERSADTRERGWRGLARHFARPAVVVGCGIAIFTQLSGIEMIIYYAPTILTDNGFSNSAALDVSVGLGATYLVMMIVGLSIVDRVGRRRLTLIMVPGTAVALAALGVMFATGNDDKIGIVVACLIVFMFFNAGGLQLMGWLTGSEIYPLSMRGAGTSLQAAVLWGTNLTISLTVLSMIDAIGPGATMWVYAGFNVLAWLFVWWRMPELTGRSLEQIETNLREGHFAPKEFAAATG
ncbi:sugar porter family MFS transporter [Jatrophihabitans endophyticus]|uniref:sugar porter family MFS transporter n=1 Tax=Jatrophihabitans endophyticus TaxID=1206085 RepID=UPI0019E0C29B|nr:sugar porter family MFS transporter [Jatrophihabitans endophyticus]MBE7189822.1 sugar porter family MFS transporter [Jatrophihabitans endophyticus]